MNTTLKFLHYGSNDITKSTIVGDLDMRAIVRKINRNIVITRDSNDWGCRVVTTLYSDGQGNEYHG